MSAGEGIPNDLNVGMAEQARALVAGVLLVSVLAFLTGFISLPILMIPVLGMLLANHEIVLFFNRRGGPVFATGALLFHQIYYLYSASAFVWVVIERVVAKMFHLKPLS